MNFLATGEVEGGVDGLESGDALVLRHDTANLDLGGSDHLDVDLVLRQRFKHLGGDTWFTNHASADNADLGDRRIDDNLTTT